jgi:hypothetical protein
MPVPPETRSIVERARVPVAIAIADPHQPKTGLSAGGEQQGLLKIKLQNYWTIWK